MNLVMTMKVKDEEDVLEDNLRFHLAQGVDFFIVTDNGSSDRTPEILEAHRRAGLMRVLDEPDPDYFRRHGEWVSNMARMAATEHAADWVVHADADEFWFPVTGTLRDILAAVREPFGTLVAPRPDFLPRPDSDGPFYERLVIREARSRLRPKKAHRAADDVIVSGGGHHVWAEADGAAVRPPGRIAERPYTEPVPPLRFVPAPWWPVRILHFPQRSSRHFVRRMESYAVDETFPDTPAVRELRRQRADGRLMERWQKLLPTPEELEAGLQEGRFVHDTALRDFLSGCPDPLAAGVEAARAHARALAGVRDEAYRRAELAALELEMMEAIARGDGARQRQRTRMRRRTERAARSQRSSRRELRRLRRRNRRLERRLDQLERSLCGRMAGLLSRLRPGR